MAYASLADLKAWRGIATGTTTDDVVLTSCLARAQQIIDTYVGMTFEAAVDSVRYVDAQEPDVFNGIVLELPGPLAAITSIVNGDGTTVTASQYVTEPRNKTPYRTLILKASSGIRWTYVSDPENAITITGRWAYSTTAPADIQSACVQLAAYIYASKDVQTFEVVSRPDMGPLTVPSGMPVFVRDILAGYRDRR